MTRIAILGLSNWAHFSWLPRGERALTERAQADANADLLGRFPQLAALRQAPALPGFAALPRPACAKVLRVSAALVHARSLRRIVSADTQKLFAVRIAPRVLHAIQRDWRAGRDDLELGATLNVLDRAAMTAAGLTVALRALDEPAQRLLMELRLPRAIAQRATDFAESNLRAETARQVLDTASALAGGEAC
ncbi:MAG TPA: hypothetical protein VGG24_08775 [Paraburkholderia sp.]|jgi:hypothetical protein